jgi:gluconate 2-dehydrogenase gamma chain
MRRLIAPEPGFLSDEQRAQAAVIFDALLPGGPDSPGATDAGAVDYLDSLLSRDPASYYELEGWRALYTRALAALDEATRHANGRGGLASLGREEVTALLERLQRGEAEGLPEDLDQRRLFTTLRNHCIEGCFSDPRWRGNRDGVMWRWLGTHTAPEAFQRGGPAAEVRHGV